MGHDIMEDVLQALLNKCFNKGNIPRSRIMQKLFYYSTTILLFHILTSIPNIIQSANKLNGYQPVEQAGFQKRSKDEKPPRRKKH